MTNDERARLLGQDLASALRHERELGDERDQMRERAEKAEAEVSALQVEVGRLNERLATSERQRAMLKEGTSPPAPSGWQPIETVTAAEKDGRDVLLLLPDGVRDVGRWFSMWDESGDGWWASHALKVAPTHWMPLPGVAGN